MSKKGMIVLKFGGTSVANAENISKTISIVRAALSGEGLMVVVSALGGATDLLLGAGRSAAEGRTDYKEKIKLIEERHFDTIKNLIPVTHQSSIIFEVKRRINELEDLCDGIFLIGEFSPRTADKIASYGELLSSLIISGASVPSMWSTAGWTAASSSGPTAILHSQRSIVQ